MSNTLLQATLFILRSTEMEVANPIDFNFDSASTSPYITAPSSPQQRRFGPFFYSAPASPAFYRAGGSPSSVPFDWEDKPGLPKGHHHVSAPSSNYGDAEVNDEDFAFDFTGHLEFGDPSPADELFAGGKIKPLKPPPRLQYDTNNSNNNSTRSSPRSPKQIIKEAFSPMHRAKGGFDPFAAALEQTRREGARRNVEEKRAGSRERARSLMSPYRVSDLLFEPDPVREPAKSPPSWYKKWRIKDLLLFRSASESRAKDNDEELVGKYESTKRAVRREDDGDVRGSSSRRRSGPSISAHEVHYTINRQLSEEMKKRTFLPYKQGLLGCLGFHPTVPDASAKGIN